MQQSENSSIFTYAKLDVNLRKGWRVVEAALPKAPTPIVILGLERADGLRDRQRFSLESKKFENKVVPPNPTGQESAMIATAVKQAFSLKF